MTIRLSDPPLQSDLWEEQPTPWGKKKLITSIWENYFRSRDERLNAAAHTDQSEALTTDQTDAIAATPIVSATNVARYRISSYLQQTVVAGVSASFQLIIRWTAYGQNLSKAGTVLNGNALTTFEAAPAFMVRADPGTNITYEVVYASNPSNVAAYRLDLVVEAMG